jgi:RimJ/RimL family protein N-acetyltransferase
MALAKDTIGLHRLVAITTPENRSSIQLLEKIGMAFERMIVLPDDPVELMLFGCRM